MGTICKIGAGVCERVEMSGDGGKLSKGRIVRGEIPGGCQDTIYPYINCSDYVTVKHYHHVPHVYYNIRSIIIDVDVGLYITYKYMYMS